MNMIGEYAGGVASNWIASTVEGAKGAALAFGGNLAGDVLAYGGGLIEGAGQTVGGKVSGYANSYGKWVNGYGDKLKGAAPASALPKSGPLASYKSAGAGAATPKRSASCGPAKSSSKALPKPVPGKVTGTNMVGGGGAAPAAIKPYSPFARDADKENLSPLGQKTMPKKKPVAGVSGGDKTNPTYKPSGASGQRPGLGRTLSTPESKGATRNLAYAPPKTKTVNGVKKTSISAASKSKAYAPYKAPEKAQGHLALSGSMVEVDAKKNYNPYVGPPKGVGGAGVDKKLDRTFF